VKKPEPPENGAGKGQQGGDVTDDRRQKARRDFSGRAIGAYLKLL